MKQIIYDALASWGKSWDFDTVERRGKALGRLLWRVLRERREMAADNMVYHLGVSHEQAKAMTKANFENIGRSFLEIFLSHRVDTRFMKERLHIPHPESYEKIVHCERPIVCATAHMGAWELQSGCLSLMMPPRGKQVVVRRPKDEALHQVMVRLRSKHDLEVVDHRNAVLKVLRNLKKGGFTGFLVDHNCSQTEAVYLPFLKKIAAVNMGPALLAIRAKALIQPAFLLRENGNYALHTEPWLDTAELTGSREAKVAQVAQFYTQAVERIVRQYPEQWYWIHRRWKTQPPEGWSYVAPENLK